MFFQVSTFVFTCSLLCTSALSFRNEALFYVANSVVLAERYVSWLSSILISEFAFVCILFGKYFIKLSIACITFYHTV